VKTGSRTYTLQAKSEVEAAEWTKVMGGYKILMLTMAFRRRCRCRILCVSNRHRVRSWFDMTQFILRIS